ncbi:MAG TPA: cell division protein ZapA [Treponemataceae bacterium]|nr:cell division protein ZapA [Treponemataceae bacterium]
MAILQIDILGTSFAIQAKEDKVYLNNLLAYYKKMVEQVDSGTNMNDQKKTAILAGIMLCDELYKEKSKNQKLSSVINTEELYRAEKLTLQMIEHIDKVLK